MRIRKSIAALVAAGLVSLGTTSVAFADSSGSFYKSKLGATWIGEATQSSGPTVKSLVGEDTKILAAEPLAPEAAMVDLSTLEGSPEMEKIYIADPGINSDTATSNPASMLHLSGRFVLNPNLQLALSQMRPLAQLLLNHYKYAASNALTNIPPQLGINMEFSLGAGTALNNDKPLIGEPFRVKFTSDKFTACATTVPTQKCVSQDGDAEIVEVTPTVTGDATTFMIHANLSNAKLEKLNPKLTAADWDPTLAANPVFNEGSNTIDVTSDIPLRILTKDRMHAHFDYTGTMTIDSAAAGQTIKDLFGVSSVPGPFFLGFGIIAYKNKHKDFLNGAWGDAFSNVINNFSYVYQSGQAGDKFQAVNPIRVIPRGIFEQALAYDGSPTNAVADLNTFTDKCSGSQWVIEGDNFVKKTASCASAWEKFDPVTRHADVEKSGVKQQVMALRPIDAATSTINLHDVVAITGLDPAKTYQVVTTLVDANSQPLPGVQAKQNEASGVELYKNQVDFEVPMSSFPATKQDLHFLTKVYEGNEIADGAQPLLETVPTSENAIHYTPYAKLRASVTAAAARDTTYNWSLEKTGAAELQKDGSSLATYTIKAAQTGTTTAWKGDLTGTVKVENLSENTSGTYGVEVKLGDEVCLDTKDATALNGSAHGATGDDISHATFNFSCPLANVSTAEAPKVTVALHPSQPDIVADDSAHEGVATVTDGVVNKNVTVTDDHHEFTPAWTIDGATATEPQTRSYTATMRQTDPCVTNIASLKGDNGVVITTSTAKVCGVNLPPTITGEPVPPKCVPSDATAEFNPLTGMTATDERDGDLTAHLTATVTPVNAGGAGAGAAGTPLTPDAHGNYKVAPGTYTVVYSVTDKDGATTTKTVTVKVAACPVKVVINAGPVIEAKPVAPKCAPADNGAVFDPRVGMTATDERDGDVTSKVTVTVAGKDGVALKPATDGTYTVKPGTYMVVYTVKDSDGITTHLTKTVEVAACPVPPKPAPSPEPEPAKPALANTGVHGTSELLGLALVFMIAGAGAVALRRRG